MNKIKCFVGRAQLYGDVISSLSMLYIIKNRYPNSEIFWPVALKARSVIPFISNHPLIDHILLSQDYEGDHYLIDDVLYNQKTDKLPFDFCLDCNPNHFDPHWYNYRNLVETNCIIAGFSKEEFDALTPEQKRPRLYRDFEIKKIESARPVIYYQSTAGYGQDMRRSPSKEWWEGLIKKCDNKYTFVQAGHPKDQKISKTLDITDVDFKEQFSYILGADLFLGLENGISWCHGSFLEAVPMVTLITNGCAGHVTNMEAWRPLSHGPSLNHVGIGNINNISHQQVIESIEQLLS